MTADTPVRPGPAGTARDLAATALVLGAASMAWFGWGQDQPPAGWTLPLTIATFASIALTAGAAGAVFRFRRGPTVMAAGRTRRAYTITVGIEVVLCLLGARGLVFTGHTAYVAPWILLVVGVHLLPLGRLFRDTFLVPAGLVLSAISIAGAVTGTVSGVAPSAVTGAFGGLVFLACSAACLRRALLRGSGLPGGRVRSAAHRPDAEGVRND